MSKCTLCERSDQTVEFIDTAIEDLEAGWLWAPHDRAYCPFCVRDKFDEIEQIEEKSGS